MSKKFKRLTAKEAATSSHKIGILDDILAEIATAKNKGERKCRVWKSNSPVVRFKLEELGFKIQDTGLAWHISW